MYPLTKWLLFIMGLRRSGLLKHICTGANMVRRLDAPWPVFWPLIAIPRPISDFFYDRVAKNRYRIFGKLDACMLPPPEVRARFLG